MGGGPSTAHPPTSEHSAASGHVKKKPIIDDSMARLDEYLNLRSQAQGNIDIPINREGVIGHWSRQGLEHRDLSHVAGAGSCGPMKARLEDRWDFPKSFSPGAGPCLGFICTDRHTQPRERHPPTGKAGRLPRSFETETSMALTPRSQAGAGGFGTPRSPGTAFSTASGALPSPRMFSDVASPSREAMQRRLKELGSDLQQGAILNVARSAHDASSPGSSAGAMPSTGFSTAGFGSDRGGYSDRSGPARPIIGSSGRGGYGM